MDALTAMSQTNEIMNGLIAGLTPEHREAATPCSDWNVHDLLGHSCGGAQMIAGGMQGMAPPEEALDFLADGPAAGWAAAHAALAAAATPERMAAVHQMPFGEVPGEVAVGVITADHVVHAWDLAQATGQDAGISDELAEWALQTWQAVVPDGPRDGGRFADAVDAAADASAVSRLIAFTGRTP